MHLNLATADAIIIDEEYDTPATNDDPHDPIVVGTSSPDPVDFLNQAPSYAFDQKKPTPMDQFSTSWEEELKSPQDGASTQRVRKTMMKDVSRRLESAPRPDSDGKAMMKDISRRLESAPRLGSDGKAMMKDISRKLESASRLPVDSDGDDVQPGKPLLSGRSKSTAQTEVSSGKGIVKAKVALYEKVTPHYDLLTMNRPSRKNGMKPKQVGLFVLVCGTYN
jgi:hypothetical protein